MLKSNRIPVGPPFREEAGQKPPKLICNVSLAPMYGLIRKILFTIDPEKVHHLVMARLREAYVLPPPKECYETTISG